MYIFIFYGIHSDNQIAVDTFHKKLLANYYNMVLVWNAVPEPGAKANQHNDHHYSARRLQTGVLDV